MFIFSAALGLCCSTKLLQDELSQDEAHGLACCRESESRSVVSDSFWRHGLYGPWNSPGQNAGLCSLSLLQGILPTQGLNSGRPHCRQVLYQMSHKGSPLQPCHLEHWSQGPLCKHCTHRHFVSPLKSSQVEHEEAWGANSSPRHVEGRRSHAPGCQLWAFSGHFQHQPSNTHCDRSLRKGNGLTPLWSEAGVSSGRQGWVMRRLAS